MDCCIITTKEVINVSSEEAEVITVDEEGHGTKRNAIKGFNIFDSPERNVIISNNSR
jgi:hypothetical protein